MGGEGTWPWVLVHLIYGAPAILAAVFAYLLRRDVRLPSGDKIGAVMERTHDLSAADVALSQQVLNIVDGIPRDEHGRPLGEAER